MENEIHISRTPKKGGQGLEIHGLVYLCVNVILFIINLAVNYNYPWHLWALLGWGIFLGSHAGTHFAIRQFSNSKSKGLGIHASVVLSINLALFGMNLLAGYSYPWHLWGLIGLGIALGIHSSVVLVSNTIADGKTKGLAIHGGVFICTNLALFFINLLAGFHNLWFRWPLLAWLLALGIHAGVIYSIKKFQQNSIRGLAINGATLSIISLFLLWVDFNQGGQLNWILYAVVPLGLAWINHYIIHLVVTPQFGQKDSLFTRMQNKTIKNMPSANKIPKQIVRNYAIHKIVFFNHLALYLLVNFFLGVINAINVGILVNPWFLYPVVSWGMAVITQATFIYSWKRRLFGKKITAFSTLGLFLSLCLSLAFQDYFSSNEYRFNWFWWGIAIAFICWIALSLYLSQLPPIHSSRLVRYFNKMNKTKIQNGDTQSVKSHRFCPNCGEINDKTQNQYCAYCGYKYTSLIETNADL